MTLRTLDEYGVRKELKRRANRVGGLIAFAMLHQLDQDHVIAVREGRAAPSAALIAALGLMRVTRYAKQPKGRAA